MGLLTILTADERSVQHGLLMILAAALSMASSTLDERTNIRKYTGKQN
jgi:hypothetical protein